MALGVNQFYKNFYTTRLSTLTTQHQIQSNRLTLFTNEVTDIANRINFFENQKVLKLSTPDGTNVAINAKYFDLPEGFDPNDSESWGDDIKYMTPCQQQIWIYKKVDKNIYDSASLEAKKGSITPENTSGVTDYYLKIPYDCQINKDADGKEISRTYTDAENGANISDARILSNKLMTGEYSLAYNHNGTTPTLLPYESLMFISEQQDETAYQETVEILEAERSNINEKQKAVQQEMNTTEVQIQAIQSMMESTEKVLTKNTESFKWG